MGHRSRLTTLMCVSSTAVLALAACGSGNGGSDNASNGNKTNAAGNCTVTFGSNTELSGDYAIYGAPAAQGLDAAAKAINAAGGVKVGDKTCKFVAANFDNKSDPAQVFTTSQKVVDSGAVAALGPDLNDTVAYQAYQKANVIDFVTGGTLSEQLFNSPQKTPLAVAMIPFQDLQHEAYLRQAMAAGPDIKTAAILFPNDSGSQSVLQEYVSAAKAVGLKLVNVTSYSPSTKDYSTFLTKIKGFHPDMLITGSSSEQSTNIMQQAAPLRVAKYYLSETATAESIQATKGLQNVSVLLPTFAPTYSSVEVLPTDHPEVIFGNKKPPLVPGAAIVLYYAAFLVKQAVEKAGSTDATKVFDALKGQSYDGPFGKCTMTSKLFMECSTVFVEVQGQKITVQQFASPYDTKPIGTYDCNNGKCTKV